MASRPAFSNPELNKDGVLSIGGESITPGAAGGDVPGTAEFVARYVAFEQDGVFVSGEASGGDKGWLAAINAPTFACEPAFAMGIEVYLDKGGDPKFLAFPWEQDVTVQAAPEK